MYQGNNAPVRVVDAKSFSECNSLELIEGKFDNLVITEDEAEGYGRYPVLVYTPNMDNVTECHHIEISRGEAVKLYNWLARYLLKN